MSVEDGRLAFRCSNSNHGRSVEQHHGIGLENIRKRLRLLFGQDYTLSINERDDSFNVLLIYLPFIMIKCIAVDDEPLALEQLTGYIARVPFLQLIASCQDAFSAMQVLSEEEVDLMFVDIHMPDLNGLDLVRSLVVKPLIVFTTAYPEYAVEGFKVDAVDYLLKPFEFQDLLKAADKARRQFEYHLQISKGRDGN